MEAAKATSLHRGIWLVSQGRVQDVSELFYPAFSTFPLVRQQSKWNPPDIYEMASAKGIICVVLEHGFLGFRKRIVAYFDKSWLERTEILPRRKKITVVGEIRAIKETGIVLENCELV